ncbi:MAG: BamA/TamA family outer membrane protein [Candidatus Latescibacterota bacterium]|jgi:hypothetical protein
MSPCRFRWKILAVAAATCLAPAVGPGWAAEAPADSAARPAGPATPLEGAARAATEQTVDAVRWMAKRRQFTVNDTDYGVTGLPIFYYGPNTGWNYGARVQVTDYGRRPYRYRATVQFLNSTADRSDTFLRLKVPRISGTGYGVLLLASDLRDIRARYYGLGNDSEFHQEFTDPHSPEYRDRSYYFYVLRRPRFILSLLRQVWGPVGLSAGFGLERTSISPHGQASFYQDQGTPDGVKDGLTGFISLTASWDTRDDEIIPKTGVFHEWSYETSRNSVLGLFFEEIDFRRHTVTDARYIPLTNRLNLAHRTVFENLSGSVPLYAYGEMGGGRRIKGLGGGDTLRGYDTQRFTDNVRFFTNTELRYQLRTARFHRQHLEWTGVVFVDAGRVWPDLQSITPRGMHLSGGLGLRLYWNDDFVISTAFGLSREQVYIPIKYRNIF